MNKITYKGLKEDLERILNKKVEFSPKNLKDLLIKYFTGKNEIVPVNSRFYLKSEDDIVYGINRSAAGVELYPTIKNIDDLKTKWEKLGQKYKELFTCYLPA